MNNDVIIRSDLQKAFPTLIEGLRKAQSIFDSIQSFKDVERAFLLGSSLSPNTYRSYLQAVKQFYEFTEGLNPLQVRPGDIEAFYDDLVTKVDRNTAYLRIRGLKRFFAGIRNVIPIYTSPFEIMCEKLAHKLNRTKKGNRKKKALNKGEMKALLAWLQEDRTLMGLCNYAMTFMLLTSGLRASELCQLKWGSLGYFENKWTAQFIGKGSLSAEQELYTLAVEASRTFFKAQYGRDPRPEDYLYWTVPTYHGEEIRPMVYATLLLRVKNIGKAAREAGQSSGSCISRLT